MSATKITPVTLTRNAVNAFPTTAACSADDGAQIQWNGPDERMFILIENADSVNSESVTIKKGDGPAAAASDLTLSLPAGEKRLVPIESARFLNTTGAARGCVLLTGSADVKVAAVLLG